MPNSITPRARRLEVARRIRPRCISIVSLFVLVIFTPVHLAALGHEMLPLDHWSYRALARFEALGLVNLPSERPFNRDQVASFVDEIQHRLELVPRPLSARDRFDLRRLEREFTDPSARLEPERRYDPPIFFLTDSPNSMEGDWDLTLSSDRTAFEKRTDIFFFNRPSLILHLGERLSYDFRYLLTFGPERDNRARNWRPSPREKSVRGLTALFERSSVCIQLDKVTLMIGREYIDWGPTDSGNLLVSRSAGSLDQAGARLQFKNLRLSFFNALLSPEARRYLAGHRLEARFGRAVLGVCESVVYAGREFDPIYMLPLSSFYSNQFNERGDDNVLWSVDAKMMVTRGLLVYGGLLVDDFQYEREDGSPDKLGFDVGWQLALSRPIALTVSVKYRYVDIYTYTHRDSINAYVTGGGDLEEGEQLIGGDPGPDSDTWTAEFSVYPRRDVTLSFNFFHQRLGEGNDFRQWARSMPSFPPFPSGVVERTLRLGMALWWELPGGSGFQAEAARTFLKNQDHFAGRDKNGTAIRLAFTWDI